MIVWLTQEQKCKWYLAFQQSISLNCQVSQIRLLKRYSNILRSDILYSVSFIPIQTLQKTVYDATSRSIANWGQSDVRSWLIVERMSFWCAVKHWTIFQDLQFQWGSIMKSCIRKVYSFLEVWISHYWHQKLLSVIFKCAPDVMVPSYSWGRL